MILLDPFYRGGNWGSERLRSYTSQVGSETKCTWFPKVGVILKVLPPQVLMGQNKGLTPKTGPHLVSTHRYHPIFYTHSADKKVESYGLSQQQRWTTFLISTSHELGVKLTSLGSPSSAHSTPLPTLPPTPQHWPNSTPQAWGSRRSDTVDSWSRDQKMQFWHQ